MIVRLLATLSFAALAGCAIEPNRASSPAFMSGQTLQVSAQNAVYQRRYGAVEFFVKDNHSRVMAEIIQGGGPYLDEAMALANVPRGDREGLRMVLLGNRTLYRSSPDALVLRLMQAGA